jgi:predicted RNA-binding Zn-ribbon protein involved in translation (DUF1610 family)
MYPQDGNGWQASRPQEPRGGGGGGGGDGEPYPESYPGDNNMHQVSAFQPNSAAFEYMRSLDSQSGGTTPPPQRDYPQQQRGPSPTPQEHSPNPGSRHSRTPRRMRRTTRAVGAAAAAVDAPGPTPDTARLVSDTSVNMPSSRPILMTGPLQSAEINRSAAPAAASMPGVGVGVYDDDPVVPIHPHAPSTSPYDADPPAPPGGLHHEQSDGSFMPAAPYQNMMQNFNNNVADPTVERARNLMAGHSENNSGPDSRPMPVAGRPLPPSTPSVEPSVPPAQLRRRILTNKPKRDPDLVRGKVVQQIQSSSKKTHVLCAGCGVMLQISKTAIVVHCPNCNGVHPTASCHVPSSHV